MSWWGTGLYLNNEQIQISDIEIINSAYGSSRSFCSRVKSKSIEHNTNLNSKPTPIHEPVHKTDLNYSYSISHYSRLPQAVSKKINLLFVSES